MSLFYYLARYLQSNNTKTSTNNKIVFFDIFQTFSYIKSIALVTIYLYVLIF